MHCFKNATMLCCKRNVRRQSNWSRPGKFEIWSVHLAGLFRKLSQMLFLSNSEVSRESMALKVPLELSAYVDPILHRPSALSLP